MDSLITILILACYAVNLVLVIACYGVAKKAMKQRGISWSDSYDSIMACVLLYAIFGPIGTVMLSLTLLSGGCKHIS